MSPILLKALHQLFLLLLKRHENALKRVDCVNQMCMDLMILETIHNGALYGYQLQGLQWIFDNFKTRKSVILADEMGLGKTMQVVCFLSHMIKGSFTTSPALILAPKSILLQWKRRQGFQKVYPSSSAAPSSSTSATTSPTTSSGAGARGEAAAAAGKRTVGGGRGGRR